MAYSLVIKKNLAGEITTNAYDTKEQAIGAYEYLTMSAQGTYQDVFLVLELTPSKEWKQATWGGTWTDAYGAVRVVGTGELD